MPRRRDEPATALMLPLPKGVVLLPGIVQRIHVSPNRPDIMALLAAVFARASPSSPRRIDTVPVAFVPMASSLLGPQGQLLLSRGRENTPPTPEPPEFDPERGSKDDLFICGVMGRITGLEGRGTTEYSLIVEGQARILVEKTYQERPHFEGKIKWIYDEVNPSDTKLNDQFLRLQQVSLRLLAFLRVATLITPGIRFSTAQLLAHRLQKLVRNQSVQDMGVLADFMANIAEATYEEKLQILAAFQVRDRVAKVIELLERQVEKLKSNVKLSAVPYSFSFNIPSDPSQQDEGEGQQLVRRPRPGRDPALPAGISGLVGPGRNSSPEEQEPDELDELLKKIEAAKLSSEAFKVAQRELKRLRKMVPVQAEYGVTRSYLETLADIPWSMVTDDRLGPDTLPRARQQLDDDHYGLEKVKKRLLEYLAVLRLKQSVNEEVDSQIKQAEEESIVLEAGKKEKKSASTFAEAGAASDAEDQAAAVQAKLDVLRSKRMVDKSPILLLVGPPGVGKTSLARSIATALGRKFHRISLGGVRDEAEIRGHRRTYVAAMPGVIVQGLRKAGVANPVFLLDEIDKLGMSNHNGDPSAAMLEVLDPEQNHTFVDHYISVPYDLSRVLFIATANSLDAISRPLLDRMETIQLPGYTTLEKRHIAMQHLIPKQVRINGLSEGQLSFDQATVSKVIESYTRESGVRNLEREIGSVCRAKAVEYADAKDGGRLKTYRSQLTVDDIERILGIEKFDEEIAEQTSQPGVVTGLVAYSTGGDGSILFIEVADMPGSGTVQLTGNLQSVLKESVEVALSWVKAHAYELGLVQDPVENIMKHRSIHVHCPSGAIPKDGPSSGMAQAIALISLFSGKAVPPSLAMTGEITLRGRITRVGGIQEKLIGALRAGVQTVILPAQNRKDVKELPHEVKKGLEIIHVNHVWDAIRHVWPNAEFPNEQRFSSLESRL